ncbi:MAG TPA: DUF3306 domain-containing protein [Gammaproteobacteria bacterium]|nr:DUF3306 domain-containing protein [Gammaproteobacteria bacterium]
MTEDKGFLSRWSDRKLKGEGDNPPAAEADGAEEAQGEDEFEGKSDDEVLSILELPDPETLKLGDTVEKFMDGRVPERIRARALRAFWKTNPVLANIDGLDEYCDDYTDAAMVIENLQTIYEVGKGYAEQALDALESLADDEEVVDELAGTEFTAQTDERIEHDKQAVAGETGNDIDTSDPRITEQNQPELTDEDALEQTMTIVPRPRRMRFDES